MRIGLVDKTHRCHLQNKNNYCNTNNNNYRHEKQTNNSENAEHGDETETEKDEESSPVENDTPEATVSDPIQGLSTRCSRTMAKSRLRSYNKYLKDYRVSVDQVQKKYQAILSDEEFFKINWANRIQQLREKTAEGGFN